MAMLSFANLPVSREYICECVRAKYLGTFAVPGYRVAVGPLFLPMMVEMSCCPARRHGIVT